MMGGMGVLKRFEIWLLLAVIAGGLAWVFSSRQDADELPGDELAEVADQPERAVVLRRSVLRRDYGNARLDLELRVANAKAEKLVMGPPAVRLVAGRNREVPGFFLPFEALPEVAAHSKGEVRLRYWLEAGDLQETLTLEVNGEPLLVKDETPLDLAGFENGRDVVMEGTAWK